MTSLVLTQEEITELTGYKVPALQLEVLHRRGFYRACIGRRGVVLERGHYDAVVSGREPIASQPPRKVANLTHLMRPRAA